MEVVNRGKYIFPYMPDSAGTVSVFGEAITSPTDMVARVGNLGLTVIAAFAFFAATVGINMKNIAACYSAVEPLFVCSCVGTDGIQWFATKSRACKGKSS